MNPTYFGLLAEFGESEIPLERVCEKYFGLSTPKAKRRACLQQLPIPAYRAGSQKSPWLISAIDLANHIDEKRLIAAPDCGLGLLGRDLTMAKLKNMCQAAKSL